MVSGVKKSRPCWCEKCGYAWIGDVKRIWHPSHIVFSKGPVAGCKLMDEHIHLFCPCGFEVMYEIYGDGLN